MLAKITDVEELELEHSEAKRLADAIAEMSKHYSVSMDPKKFALLNLAATAGGIYGSRAVAYALKRRERGKLQAMPAKESEAKPEAPAAAGPDRGAWPRTPADLWSQPATLA